MSRSAAAIPAPPDGVSRRISDVLVTRHGLLLLLLLVPPLLIVHVAQPVVEIGVCGVQFDGPLEGRQRLLVPLKFS